MSGYGAFKDVCIPHHRKTRLTRPTRLNCQAPYDYIPKMSYPLLQAREVLRLLAEEGIEGSVKEAEPRGDGI